MRRSFYKKYFLLGFLFLVAFSLPVLFIEKLRNASTALFSPVWKRSSGLSHESQRLTKEIQRLESENHLLRSELIKYRSLLDQQTSVQTAVHELDGFFSSGQERRVAEVVDFLKKSVLTIPAQIIYRDPVSWTSSVWINVGEETNQRVGKTVIAVNSPVVIGRGLVGAIDSVGFRQSRVRLITDSGLKPSVRVVRGHLQNLFLVEQLDAIQRNITGRTDLPVPKEELFSFLKTVEVVKGHFSHGFDGWHLAKGIMQGKGTPLWRGGGMLLRGIGFNYDFSDEEGPARDLRTGRTLDDPNHFILPLIQPRDLLVTTGLDGIFPSGLKVAEVIKVHPLREGAYTFEIDAIPVVGNLDEIHTVFVMAPIGFETHENI